MGSLLNGFDYDALTFQDKRREFLRALLNKCQRNNKFFKNHCKYLPDRTLNVDYYPEFKVYTLTKNQEGDYELSKSIQWEYPFDGNANKIKWTAEDAQIRNSGKYREERKSVVIDGEYFDGLNFNPEWNTRDILLSEGVIEVEDKNNFQLSLKGSYEVCLSLIKYNIHFAVFYAEGMKTLHIHIYDLFPHAQDWAEKNIAMALFCRKIVPFEYFHLLDTALWEEHTIALEFAKHWRTGHIKKLLFEHVPVMQEHDK